MGPHRDLCHLERLQVRQVEGELLVGLHGQEVAGAADAQVAQLGERGRTKVEGDDGQGVQRERLQGGEAERGAGAEVDALRPGRPALSQRLRDREAEGLEHGRLQREGAQLLVQHAPACADLEALERAEGAQLLRDIEPDHLCEPGVCLGRGRAGCVDVLPATACPSVPVRGRNSGLLFCVVLGDRRVVQL